LKEDTDLRFRLENGVAKTCAELGIMLLAYAPLSHGFLTGHIKSFDDIPDGDFRKTGPRFQPDVFDENMKLVEEVRRVAEKKGFTVSASVIFSTDQKSKPE
jgi:pyridoxine 4-dehydrogenase